MGNHKIFHNDRHYLAYIFLGKVLKQKFSSNVLRNLQPVSVAVAVTAALPARTSITSNAFEHAAQGRLLSSQDLSREWGSSPKATEAQFMWQRPANQLRLLVCQACTLLVMLFYYLQKLPGSCTELLCTELRSFVLAFTALTFYFFSIPSPH